MAWITPKTDWTAGDRFTYTDGNRVAGNINYLLPLCGVAGGPLKDDYTQNDFHTVAEWAATLTLLQECADAVEASTGHAVTDYSGQLGYSVISDTFNAVESLSLEIKDWLDILENQAKVYAGDGFFVSAAPEVYMTGGTV